MATYRGSRASHHGTLGGVTHDVRVLQTNAWPEKPDDAPVVPCPETLGPKPPIQCLVRIVHVGFLEHPMHQTGGISKVNVSFGSMIMPYSIM